MDYKNLARANELKKEILELDRFIHAAGCVPSGKIIKEKQRYIFKSSDYGYFREKEYHMNMEIKNKVLDVLKEHLKELKLEFENL